LTRVCGTRRDESFGILNYHRVAPCVAGLPRPTINVTPERFCQQIAGLQQRGYTIRPLAEMLRIRRLGLPLPPRTVVLTFDDGFASVYKYAWPILRELQAPATIFLCTAFIESEAPFPFDPWAAAFQRQAPRESWRPLRFDECREMLASGLIEFGAHTHTHQDFRLRPSDFADDLRTNCESLRAQLGLREISFAFPFGYSDEELMGAVREAGTTCALTVDGRLNPLAADPFGWGRFTAYDYDTAGTLAAKREGWYGWVVARCKRCGRLARKLTPPWRLEKSAAN
jgi:peptidoglycan/xylan/chitin deacetylase (PgdA/CDA1 family)